MTPAKVFIENFCTSFSIYFEKLFCCADCRERHEKNKHANRQMNCPLCMSQKLPLKPIEDTKLFCHIVITHLPLHCSLCGEIFKQSKDLESFGTCKWWKARQRHSLVTQQKSELKTPPLLSEGKESSAYNGNSCSLTSPPELYRNTSTPMGVCQKTSFDFITPNVPNFSLQTPQTDTASLNTDYQSCTSKVENSGSNYMSFPSTTNHEETPFRSVPSTRSNKDELPRSNSRNLNIMNNQSNVNSNEHSNDNHCVEDMELTGVESKILPDSQGLENPKSRRSDSLKRVRFSDEYQNHPASSTMNTPNMTTNEEYYEACDTLSDIKESLENSQMDMYAENIKNAEKENRSPDKANANANSNGEAVSGSSRVVMMVVVENNSTLSTSDVIETSLKKLGRIASSVKLSSSDHSSPASITSVDSYYSVTSRNYRSSPTESNSSVSRDSNSSTVSNDSISSGGILSVFANAVRNVMKNFPGVGTSRTLEEQQSSQDTLPRLSSSESLSSELNLPPSLLQRAGKRPRDTIESSPSSPRQLEFSSPLPKRPRGWYRIKGREPIARMRNNRITSPRGISSETQVFHQGSLSVGDTVLPLPSRAHQSTQTD
ncbi:uncharacterized protein LOC114875434 isoform X1 [Osmia bicornis bicornis]|uniref:uncharacterized protein LOC114875434 isoform X1 n=2 Tax=Osmia bicornis bicornis TaxID=1437191 RepID=UPI001EAF4E36|nr:uncharacterized protein LOC114875434 isoform X1 [Osmia bicornis bicornis]